MGGYVIYAKWAPETLIALGRCQENGDREPREGAEGSVSISPAELMGAAFMLEAVGILRLDMPLRRFVEGCDNSSACFAVNRRRVKSYPMHAALRCVLDRERAWGLRMRLDHYPTKENKVADFLSRGRIKEAMDIVRGEVGWCEVRTLDAAWVARIEKAVREACPE